MAIKGNTVVFKLIYSKAHEGWVWEFNTEEGDLLFISNWYNQKRAAIRDIEYFKKQVQWAKIEESEE